MSTTPASPRVDVVIVGAQKCGTTTLAELLSRHPAICLADGKEAHLFDRHDVQRRGPTTDDLEASFAHRQPGQLLLDATPSYLYLPGCLESMVRHAPDVAIVVILRSPAERAVSHHGHERRLGAERFPLLAALALERRRLRRDADPLAEGSAHRHGSYLDRGRYAPQLARLRSLSDRVHVVLLGDLVANPQRTVDGVADFVGVERHPVGDVPHLNAGDGRRRPVATAIARRILHRDRLEAETVLGLPPGSLR